MGLKNYLTNKANNILQPLVKNILNDESRLDRILEKKDQYSKLNEYYVWFIGDDELLYQFYMYHRNQGFHVSPKASYFWAVSAKDNSKKTHSGLPSAIVETLVNIQGEPKFTIGEEIKQEEVNEDGISKITITQNTEQQRIDEIIKDNKYMDIIKQHETPFVLALGDGAFKLSCNTGITKYPIIEFVDGRNVEYSYIKGRCVAIDFSSYYIHDKKPYTLIETYTDKSITYKLYDKSKKIVPLTKIPQTEMLVDIEHNCGAMLAVPVRFKNNKIDQNKGRSIFDTKLTLFDDLDQTHSVLAEQVRKSVAVTFVDTSIIETNSSGDKLSPKTYKKDYVVADMKQSEDSELIKTIQPQIDYEKLSQVKIDLMVEITVGLLSMSSLGVETARSLNATAQREKEKVSIFTRNDMIDNQERVLSRVLELALKLEDSMNDRIAGEYEVVTSFNEFANPTMEELISVYTPLFGINGMSVEMLVDTIWGDSKTPEEKALEIQRLNDAKSGGTDDYFNYTNDTYNKNIDEEDTNEDTEDNEEDIE